MQRLSGLRVAGGRLRQGWRPVLEATVAATVAWLLATRLLGHPQPFFAPAAALIVLGQARGQRIRRAVEVVLGVAAGVLVADLVVQALGPGSTWTVFTVILLTVLLAVAFGATGVTLVQAAVSALYLVVVAPPDGSLVPFRFVDALIGGAVALAASLLVDARHPLAPLVAEVRRTFDELAGLLGGIADALDHRDERAAMAALTQARGMDVRVDGLREGVLAAGEALRLNVRRRRHIGRLRSVDESIRQIDYAVRNVRVLARAGVTLSRLHTPVSPQLGVALRALAEAVREAGAALAADLDGREEAADRHASRADESALAAVHTAGQLFGSTQALPLAMIIGQVRATAIDLLRGVNPDDDAAILTRVDKALGLPTP
ncbi:FUSC family protein [Micromonospora sp. STR1_7]|uniref:FUSC family protein n=1 Tax=Micromonospora parastrephiae TaxID=2806101 RepID=A0ABS1Y280_9ACTN|nr:FUSC family protein [Micromonospora parastrephiae]MBM0235625.1 FUSC family protein [Micromonospora parastrephiae]